MSLDTLEDLQAQPCKACQNAKILIIDEDHTAVDVLSYRLKRQGFMTACAETGREAVAMIQKDPPDLILLEPRLPDIDGFELCEMLTDASETCLIPIILISGGHHPDIVRQSRKSGARFFIHKPYDPDNLLLVIQHLLRSADEAPIAEEEFDEI